MTRASLRPPALCEVVADRIRDRILRQELLSGEFVDERALAVELGVSRTPVREALRILHHEGLLTAKARKGMYVTQLSTQQMEQAAQLRDTLIRQLAASGHTPLLDKLMALVDHQLQLQANADAQPKTVRKW